MFLYSNLICSTKYESISKISTSPNLYSVFKLTPRPGPTSSILRFLLVSNKPIKYFKISIRPEYHQLLWSFSSGM